MKVPSKSVANTVAAPLAEAFTLVALITCVPGDAGAVYRPVAEIFPTLAFPSVMSSTDHRTALEEMSSTVAWNCTFRLTRAAAVTGWTETDTDTQGLGRPGKLASEFAQRKVGFARDAAGAIVMHKSVKAVANEVILIRIKRCSVAVGRNLTASTSLTCSLWQQPVYDQLFLTPGCVLPPAAVNWTTIHKPRRMVGFRTRGLGARAGG